MDSNEHGTMERNEEHLGTNISIYYTHETELYAERYDAMNRSMDLSVDTWIHSNKITAVTELVKLRSP